MLQVLLTCFYSRIFLYFFHSSKKLAAHREMATHSSVLPWRIPGTGEPGGLPSMGSCRVGYDWSNLAAAETPQRIKAVFTRFPCMYVEKAMAPHSSTLAWKIPWTEEPGRLQSMGSWGVGHDWVTSLSLFTFHFHAVEKAMATHSSVLAWRIPGMVKTGGLPSMGLHRVGHDWNDLAAAAAASV